MKIKFDTGDELPLSKTTKIPTKTIVFRAFFVKIINIIHNFFR